MANAFKAKKHDPRLTSIDWDEYYIERKVVDSVKKTGEGEEDFTIVPKIIESKTLIKDVIDAQSGDVGLVNILKKFALTNDQSILPSNVSDDGTIQDFTGMPQDLVEAGNYFDEMKAKFDALPDELKQGRDFNAFMATITQAQFDAYINSLKPKDKVIENGKEGE